MKPLLIGIDPGSTSAIAIANLNGEIIHLESSKNFPPSEMIKVAVKKGKPVLVASDKQKMPSKVEKFANSLGTGKYQPEKDLSKQRKRELGQGDNLHEIDASASVIHAYNDLKDNIKKLKRIADEQDLRLSKAAKKYFNNEINSLIQNQEEEVQREQNEKLEKSANSTNKVSKEKYVREKEKFKTRINNLQEQVEQLKEDLENEKKLNKKLNKRLDDLREDKRQDILKERELSKKNAKIKEKEEKIDSFKEEIQNSEIREKQYIKAIEIFEKGGVSIPIVEEYKEDFDRVAVETEELKQKYLKNNIPVELTEDLEGAHLGNKMVVENPPEITNFEKLVKNYKDRK